MLSHGMTWPYNQRDMGLSNKFDAYRSCRNGNITFLFCQLTSCNHMIKGTYDLVSGSQSTYAITVKFDAYRCCGNRDTAFLFCHMVCDHIMKWSTWSCMLYRGAHIYIYIYIYILRKTLQSSVLVYHKNGPWLRSLYCNDTWTSGTIVINIVNINIINILKLFVTLGVQRSWSTCGEWMGNFEWAFMLLFVTNSVSRFVTNLWIGRIESNLRKKRVFSMWP